jgi:hypothetical protein
MEEEEGERFIYLLQQDFAPEEPAFKSTLPGLDFVSAAVSIRRFLMSLQLIRYNQLALR